MPARSGGGAPALFRQARSHRHACTTLTHCRWRSRAAAARSASRCGADRIHGAGRRSGKLSTRTSAFWPADLRQLGSLEVRDDPHVAQRTSASSGWPGCTICPTSTPRLATTRRWARTDRVIQISSATANRLGRLQQRLAGQSAASPTPSACCSRPGQGARTSSRANAPARCRARAETRPRTAAPLARSRPAPAGASSSASAFRARDGVVVLRAET